MVYYLPHASNLSVHNLTITHTNGNAAFGNSERQGLKLLLSNISNGAFHDSAERRDPPKCHPETRVAIQKEIMEWIKAPEATRKFILWMYGPAGSGKTAIAQSVAEECKKQGLLAASFFSCSAPGRNDTRQVVATIAYQISRFLPQIENCLFTAIEHDPTIFSRALPTQLQVLVVEPLKSVLAALAGPILVILDGLDECGPDAHLQAYFLSAIGTAISELQHIPLIFVIVSRPEYKIHEAFKGPLLHSFMRPIELDDHFNPDADIKLYFNFTFRQIHGKHLRQGIPLSSTWPSNSDVDRLISKASGQFIFAATVMRFINSIQYNPVERLNIVLGLSATGNETPFAFLDALYCHILSRVANLPQVLEILTLLILTMTASPGRMPPTLTVGVISDLLEIEVRRALVDMHALVFVPLPTNDSSVVRIHHASLYDFLMDRSRSHDYYIDKTQGHITLTRRWLRVIENHSISTNVSYSTCVENFNYHCSHSPASHEIVDDLAHFNLKTLSKEMLTDFYRTTVKTPWLSFFCCIERQVKVPRRKLFDSIMQRVGARNDLARLKGEFLARFIECLSKYPPTLRDSILTALDLSSSTPEQNAFLNLACVVCRSQEEIDETLKLDLTLLKLQDTVWSMGTLPDVFRYHTLVGHYYVHSGSYLALAKQIISVIFPKPTQSSQPVKFRRTFRTNVSFRTIDIRFPFKDSFEFLLCNASVDFDLARFLLDHALQYKDEQDSREIIKRIAEGSLAYIQRCGLLFLKHTHLEDTDRCVVCDKYGAASVVVGTHSLGSQSYHNIFFQYLQFSVRNGSRSFRRG